MGLYRRPDSPYWWYQRKVRHLPPFKARSTGTADKKQAEIISKIWEADYLKGNVNQTTVKIPWKSFINNYIRLCRHESAFPTKERSLKYLMNVFKISDPRELTRDIVEHYITSRLDDAKESTVNRELSPLRHCYRVAVEKKILESSPFYGIKFFSEKKLRRNRYLTTYEKTILLPVLSLRLWRIVVVALQTGMRQGEMLNLLLDELDMEKELIYVRAGDEDDNRILPMTPDVKAIFMSLPRISQYAFCNEDGTKLDRNGWLKYEWDMARQKAGIKDFTFHDLKHTWVTDMNAVGANAKAVSTMAGHSETYMTERYKHVDLEFLKTQMAKLPSITPYAGITHKNGNSEIPSK